NRLSLRNCSIPGVPLRTRSIGIVSCRSTSGGARPGILVMTVTCTFVTSGNASIGVSRKARNPKTATTSVANRVATRRVALAWMIRSITNGSKQEVGSPVQQQRVVHHDALARTNTLQDRDPAPVGSPDGHRPALERPGLVPCHVH